MKVYGFYTFITVKITLPEVGVILHFCSIMWELFALVIVHVVLTFVSLILSVVHLSFFETIIPIRYILKLNDH